MKNIWKNVTRIYTEEIVNRAVTRVLLACSLTGVLWEDRVLYKERETARAFEETQSLRSISLSNESRTELGIERLGGRCFNAVICNTYYRVCINICVCVYIKILCIYSHDTTRYVAKCAVNVKRMAIISLRRPRPSRHHHSTPFNPLWHDGTLEIPHFF